MGTYRVRPVTTSDYRRLAEKRLPRFLFDYIDGGANEEISMFQRIKSGMWSNEDEKDEYECGESCIEEEDDETESLDQSARYFFGMKSEGQVTPQDRLVLQLRMVGKMKMLGPRRPRRSECRHDEIGGKVHHIPRQQHAVPINVSRIVGGFDGHEHV